MATFAFFNFNPGGNGGGRLFSCFFIPGGVAGATFFFGGCIRADVIPGGMSGTALTPRRFFVIPGGGLGLAFSPGGCFAWRTEVGLPFFRFGPDGLLKDASLFSLGGEGEFIFFRTDLGFNPRAAAIPGGPCDKIPSSLADIGRCFVFLIGNVSVLNPCCAFCRLFLLAEIIAALDVFPVLGNVGN